MATETTGQQTTPNTQPADKLLTAGLVPATGSDEPCHVLFLLKYTFPLSKSNATPIILQGNKYMDATLYTGTGTTQVIVNQAQFKPDLVWAKTRSSVSSNLLYDSIRGVNQYLSSNQTAAEATLANSLITSFVVNVPGFVKPI